MYYIAPCLESFCVYAVRAIVLFAGDVGLGWICQCARWVPNTHKSINRDGGNMTPNAALACCDCFLSPPCHWHLCRYRVTRCACNKGSGTQESDRRNRPSSIIRKISLCSLSLVSLNFASDARCPCSCPFQGELEHCTERRMLSAYYLRCSKLPTGIDPRNLVNQNIYPRNLVNQKFGKQGA